MNFPLSVRLALRDLRGQLGKFRVFLACLALGVAALAAVGTVRSSIQAGLEREGAALLGGDAQAEFTYRFAREDEIAWLESISESLSETVDFRSMAVVEREETERGLTQVRAVDDAYPLIGQVRLNPPLSIEEALHGAEGLPGSVMEPLLADRLALSPGDTFRLGAQRFRLMAILESYPDNIAGGFRLGPRTIVRTEDLRGSGLLAEGTLFSTQYRLNLPESADLTELKNAAEDRFTDTGLRWRDAREGAPGISRFIDRIGAFLVLIGLSGLAVGGVGVSTAVRAYLSDKTSTIATLKTLGATRATIFRTYFIQIGAITLIGVALGLILGAGLPYLTAPLIESRLPLPAEFALYPAPLIEATIYGVLAAMIFTLWPLARVEEIRAATLFRDAFAAGRILPAPRYLVATALLLSALVLVAIWFSDNARLTLWTTAGIIATLGVLALAAFGARRVARWSARGARGRPAFRLALGAISARGGETTSVILSLGLGLAVLSAVGQIDGNLRKAITMELPDVAPSYFFVDIQPDQIEGFRARLDNDPQVKRVESAPMLRGILTRINGRDAREVAGEHWVLRGDRGVTYSDVPPADTTVTRGEWWPSDYSGPPQVSFAEEEALEMGLELGDEITVNILGRDITAEITSFREVSFETAGIGFIMAMNPSALAGAPHSWISTVYAEQEAEAQILRDLADAYPNITAIRIRDAIDQVAEVLSGISAATRYGAAVTLLTGFLVLIGAAIAGEPARVFEAAVLKTLGATRKRILLSFALRAALLGAAAGVVALCAGLLGGWAVSTFVMESSYSVIWSSAAAIVLGGIGASTTAGLLFALRPLAARPASVLRARE